MTALNDPLIWFFGKHFYVAALIFPEIAFVWALWIKLYPEAIILGLFLGWRLAMKCILRGIEFANSFHPGGY